MFGNHIVGFPTRRLILCFASKSDDEEMGIHFFCILHVAFKILVFLKYSSLNCFEQLDRICQFYNTGISLV